MFVTWKVSDIIEVIEGIIWVLFNGLPTIGWPLLLGGVGYPITWVYNTPIEDLIYDVVPLTYGEQKWMGRLHHCKVYQD